MVSKKVSTKTHKKHKRSRKLNAKNDYNFIPLNRSLSCFSLIDTNNNLETASDEDFFSNLVKKLLTSTLELWKEIIFSKEYQYKLEKEDVCFSILNIDNDIFLNERYSTFKNNLFTYYSHFEAISEKIDVFFYLDKVIISLENFLTFTIRQFEKNVKRIRVAIIEQEDGNSIEKEYILEDFGNKINDAVLKYLNNLSETFSQFNIVGRSNEYIQKKKNAIQSTIFNSRQKIGILLKNPIEKNLSNALDKNSTPNLPLNFDNTNKTNNSISSRFSEDDDADGHVITTNTENLISISGLPTNVDADENVITNTENSISGHSYDNVDADENVITNTGNSISGLLTNDDADDNVIINTDNSISSLLANDDADENVTTYTDNSKSGLSTNDDANTKKNLTSNTDVVENSDTITTSDNITEKKFTTNEIVTTDKILTTGKILKKFKQKNKLAKNQKNFKENITYYSQEQTEYNENHHYFFKTSTISPLEKLNVIDSASSNNLLVIGLPLLLTLTSVGVAVGLGILLYFCVKKYKARNKKLEQQNEVIEIDEKEHFKVYFSADEDFKRLKLLQ